MVVGHHIAVGRDDEARAQATGNLLTGLTGGHLTLATLRVARHVGDGTGREEAAEELEEGIVGVKQFFTALPLDIAGMLGRADVDDGAAGLLHQAREVGQLAHGLGVHGSGLHQGDRAEQGCHRQRRARQHGTQRASGLSGDLMTGPVRRMGDTH